MSVEAKAIVVERGIESRMRDGTVLRADVYRPAADGQFPVLLERIPYNKALLPLATLTLDPITAALAGYVVVIQDTRGRFTSDGGPFYMYRDEYEDGYDSVEWAAGLPWSSGRVGMFGASYMGMTQWQAAAMRPPHLEAIFPCTAADGVHAYRGGALEWGLLATWTLAAIGPNAVLRARPASEARAEFLDLARTLDRLDEVYETLPPAALPGRHLGNGFARFFDDIVAHPNEDDYHRRIGMKGKHAEVVVPAFILAGWYDALLGCDLDHFARARSQAGSPRARERTRIMVGPWAHAGFSHMVGERNFGLAASGLSLDLRTDLTSLQIRWFDRWLKDARNGVDEEPPVKLFVMGDNVWRDETDWPLSRAQYVPIFLHSGGRANAVHGDGTLSPDAPGEERPDHFVYDPSNPVPSCGGNHLLPANHPRGPLDQRAVEERPDVLVYTSRMLDADLEVTGPVVAKLHAATSAKDTDFTAKLVDVLPDGRALNICDGIIRASHRGGSAAAPCLLEPGRAYEYTIDLWATSNVFKRGHRLRLEISSSNFPRFDRNPNTGEPAAEATRLTPAFQSVFHDVQRASHVLLPIVPR